MKGYTAKVGLRKSPLYFDVLRMRQMVRKCDHHQLKQPPFSITLGVVHDQPILCYEDDDCRCACETCISQPVIRQPRPNRKPPSQEPVRAPRPCCHTTGPNHHPACQDKP